MVLIPARAYIRECERGAKEAHRAVGIDGRPRTAEAPSCTYIDRPQPRTPCSLVRHSLAATGFYVSLVLVQLNTG